MINRMHYTLRTISMSGTLVNAVTNYDIYFDSAIGIAYEIRLEAPEIVVNQPPSPPTGPESAVGLAGGLPETVAPILPMPLITWWHARIVNYVGQQRLEYDLIKKIYYQTRQIIDVERPLYNLQDDIRKFLAANPTPVEPIMVNGRSYPGYQLHTLTIWIDPVNMIPMRRLNRDRGYTITDEFTYQSLNAPIPEQVFRLPKPTEAIADFDLYPQEPTLPRFQNVLEQPQYGVWVNHLLEQLKRHIILNQWEFGPFATIDLPWLTEMPVTIYRARTLNDFPPLVVDVAPPMMPTYHFLVSYDFLGYVVTGFTVDEYDLSRYERLPITTTMTLVDLVPLYQSPSYEKFWVVRNFMISVQANDFFINAFRMGGKTFELLIKNFSFEENEGYLLLNVYGKEYWDNANIESMFQFIVTGQMADRFTTPIMIYAGNVFKRLGIFTPVTMPVYEELPAGEPAPEGMVTPTAGTTPAMPAPSMPGMIPATEPLPTMPGMIPATEPLPTIPGTTPATSPFPTFPGMAPLTPSPATLPTMVPPTSQPQQPTTTPSAEVAPEEAGQMPPGMREEE